MKKMPSPCIGSPDTSSFEVTPAIGNTSENQKPSSESSVKTLSQKRREIARARWDKVGAKHAASTRRILPWREAQLSLPLTVSLTPEEAAALRQTPGWIDLRDKGMGGVGPSASAAAQVGPFPYADVPGARRLTRDDFPLTINESCRIIGWNDGVWIVPGG